MQKKDSPPEVLYYYALQLIDKEKFNDAIDLLLDSIKRGGDFFEALYSLGQLYFTQGDHKKALHYFRKALVLDKKNFTVYFEIGTVLQDLEQYEEAILNYDKSIKLNIEYPEALLNKGICLRKIGKINEAILSIKNALEINPSFTEGYSSLGFAQSELKQYEEALNSLNQAIAINPNHAQAWINKGHVLSELQQYEEALNSLNQAIAINPNHAQAWINKGHVLWALQDYEKAKFSYEKTKKLDKNYKGINGYIIHAKMQLCDWSDCEKTKEEIFKKIEMGLDEIAPFAILSVTDNLEKLRKSSEIFSKKINFNTKKIKKGNRNEKIRVAYFSSDFNEHPVAHSIVELFELHDKNQFTTYGFSYGRNDNSNCRKRIESALDNFFDVQMYTDKAIASLAQNLNIDIAIDLGGYTAKNRIKIFSYQAAPIQISYLGFLGTLCHKNIDYIFADEILIPREHQKNYSEKIIYLPWYQINDSKRMIAREIFKKSDFGIPEDKFVFCNFCNNFKITPKIFKLWATILKAVPDSILFLYANNTSVEINLFREFKKAGIEESRIKFSGKLPKEKYLERYRVCDLFLDTNPYNGGVTTSDALWTNLPVITLQGNSFASRMSASLLHAVGHPELIAYSENDYLNLAINLANNPENIKKIKLSLDSGRKKSPLFNSKLLTKYIERAYITVHEQNITGSNATHVYLDHLNIK